MGKRLFVVSIVAVSACILTAHPVEAQAGLDFAGGLFQPAQQCSAKRTVAKLKCLKFKIIGVEQLKWKIWMS